MTVIYVAGPYRGRDAWHTETNVRRAEALALDVWRAGAVAICPHAMNRFFNGAIDDQQVLDGCVELMARCDAVITAPDWSSSVGAAAEIAFAIAHGLPVFEDVQTLAAWIDAGVRLGMDRTVDDVAF